jgi:uncharacterized protein YbjT (DUF2867 family)
MAGDRVLVTAASGKSAMQSVRRLAERGANVRAFVRREETRAALIEAGAREVVVGDLLDKASLSHALQGIDSVLHICPPMHPQEDQIANDLISASCAAGVRHYVMWSVLHPHAHVPHHQRKQKAEGLLIDSGLDYTILQPGRYMQHLETVWSSLLKTGIHAFPFSTTAPFSLVHLDDLATAAATVLTEPGHKGAIYELAGPQVLTQEDCAAIISHELGRSIRAERIDIQLSAERARANGLPDWRVETLRIMNEHYDHHGLAGNGNVLQWLLGRPSKSFADYVRELMASQS